MIEKTKIAVYKLLKKSEKWTKTDMIYLAKGGFWLTLGQIAASITSLVLAVILANFLPKETYGEYKYIMSIFGILSIFTLGGINTIIFQNAYKETVNFLKKSIKTKIKFGLIGSIICLLIAAYYWAKGNQQISLSLIIIAPLIPVVDSISSYDQFLQGRKKINQSTIYFILNQIIIILSIFFVIKLHGNSLTSIIIIYFLSNIISRLFFLNIVFKKNKEIEGKTTEEELNNEIKYGIKLSLINIIPIIAQNIDKLIIFNMLDAPSLAIYSIALTAPEKIKSFIKSWYILFINKVIKKQKESVIKSFFKRIPMLIIIITIIIIFLLIIIKPFFNLLFKNYLDSILYAKIYSLSIFGVLSVFPISIMNLYKETKKLKNLNIIRSLIQIALIIIFTYHFGLMGAIVSRILTELATFFVSILMLTKINLSFYKQKS